MYVQIYQQACYSQKSDARVGLHLCCSDDGERESQGKEGVQQVAGEVGQPVAGDGGPTHKLQVLCLALFLSNKDQDKTGHQETVSEHNSNAHIVAIQVCLPHISLIQVIEVGAWQRMVVDSESEVGIVGSLPQPHIVEGIQSCC
jgi:hypothetical protein